MAHRNTGLINVYQPKPLSKPLVVFFSLTQLFFGPNYGFFNILNKNLRALANFTSVLAFIVIVTLSWMPFYQVWLKTAVNVYFIWVFFVLRFSNYTFFQFLSDIMDIDEKWNLTVDPHVGLKAMVYMCTWFGIRGLFYLYLHIFNFFVEVDGWLQICHWVSQHSIFTVLFILSAVNMLVFYQVYLRINVLKSSLLTKRIRLKDARLIFKSLADCLAKIRVWLDNMTAVGFGVHFLRGVFAMGFQLQYSVREKWPVANEIHITVEILQWLLEISMPAVFAEMMAAEVDEIIMVIHEHLLTETDEDTEKDLLRLLRYVEARPLLRKAWRLVPVDLRQPVTLLSMSVTYLIVVLQFGHVF